MQSESREASLHALTQTEFDVLVVGGGIFGAAAVWEAQMRGLNAALIEASDFCQGSSANSYKIIHGGIRYMQHLDLPRVWASSRERSAFMRIAPHLCTPLPIMIPTYGWLKLGMPFLGMGCVLYDLATAHRNRGISDPQRRIHFTRFIGKQAVLDEYPDTDPEGLTGACIFNDGRFYNPTRLVWAFAEAAREAGASICNYLAAEELIVDNKVVRGVVAQDRVSGEHIEIRSKCLINTAGPWAERLLQKVTQGDYRPQGVYSRDACFVVDRKFDSDITLAVQGESADPDAILAREKRHLFISPWRDYTLIGTWHKVTDIKPEDVTVDDSELEQYIEEINTAHPQLGLKLEDVRMWNAGLVPFGEEQKSEQNLSYGKRSNIIDHAESEGLENFITLVGLRYTMARGESEKVLKMAEKKLGKQASSIKTDFLTLPSANFNTFDELCSQVQATMGQHWGEQACTALAHNYGAYFSRVIALIDEDRALAELYENTTVSRAEVQYVCQHEMVETLADVVFRRTDMATGGNPGGTVLKAVLDQVSSLKGWQAERRQQELAVVLQRFPGHCQSLAGANDEGQNEQKSASNF